PVVGARAESELPLNHGAAQGGADLVARAAVLGCGETHSRVTVDRREARLRLDETDGTALGARAEQCALRASENLYSIEVENQGRRVGPRYDAVVETDLHRHFVDIDAGGRVTGDAGGDAPDGKCDGRTGVLKVNARGYGSDVSHVDDLPPEHFVSSEN